MQFKAGALELVRKDGFKLFGLKRRFREDPEVRVAALQQNGWALEQLKDEFKDDATVVRVAAAQWDNAHNFASERLQNDQDFLDSIWPAAPAPATPATTSKVSAADSPTVPPPLAIAPPPFDVTIFTLKAAATMLVSVSPCGARRAQEDACVSPQGLSYVCHYARERQSSSTASSAVYSHISHYEKPD